MSVLRNQQGQLLGSSFMASIDREGKRTDKSNCAYIVSSYHIPTGYRAYILPARFPKKYAYNIISYCPTASVLYGILDTDVFGDYDVVEVDEQGVAHIVYCDKSSDNVLFVTNKCNSNCIMCPDADINRRKNLGARQAYLKKLIELIPTDTPHITITGGEPTLLKWEFIELLKLCRDKFQITEFLMLSNGRTFCVKEYREAFLEAIPKYFRLAVPLYADNAQEHDAITRSPGSFDQTLTALKVLQKDVELEVRIVIMRQNYKKLPSIASFIKKELPYTKWVSFMGMELLGNAAISRDSLWVDYIETAGYLEQATQELLPAGINPSIYNYPLCGLPRHLWSIAAQSITDYKVRYKSECDQCRVKDFCGGFFFSTINYDKVKAKPVV